MNRKLLRPFYKSCFLLFFIFFFNGGYAQYVFHNNALPQTVSLHPYTTIADVGPRDLSIQYILLHYNDLHPVKLKAESDDLGFTQNNFWANVSIENPTDSALLYYLETARPITNLVELYSIDKLTGRMTKAISGNNMPYAMRSFDNRKTIFKIDLPPRSSYKMFLHLKSDGEVLKIPMLLHTSESFIKMIAKEQFVFGIFYGILTIAAIIYFFFFFALGEKTFLYYSLYVVFIGLLQFAIDGYFYQLITPGGGWFSRHAILIFALIAAFLLGKYSEVFLNIRKCSKTIYFLYNLVYIFAFVQMAFLLFVPSAFAVCYPLANILGLLVLLLIISSVICLYYKKQPVSIFFSVGIMFLIIGFGIFILNNFGEIPNSFLSQNSSKLGTGFEVIFLSLSMANLIRNLKNDKNELTKVALARSEEMNDLKSYFLSNISHELRTPLNAIMNMTDSISKESKDENIKNDCKIIKYSSQSLLSSVNDILDFSKIDKGELRLEEVQFHPAKVLEHIKNNFALQAHNQGLAFEYSVEEPIPNLCIGDVARLSQIINNVLSNAIKFTSEGIVKFNVSAQEKPGDRTKLTMVITDTGIGISKEKMSHIFESFTQDNINNKRKFGGLGLGLFIVKTLVDMQKGTIEMDSKPGQGTTCTIKIEYAIAGEQPLETVLSEAVVFDLNGKNILVVEDNAINQLVIKTIIKKWLNTTATYAINGQECLDALKIDSFDIILMDLQMPVMDGYEATIAIRNGEAGESNTNIPIIAVTADVMESTKMRVKEIGMDFYISKPLKNDTLFNAVKNLA